MNERKLEAVTGNEGCEVPDDSKRKAGSLVSPNNRDHAVKRAKVLRRQPLGKAITEAQDALAMLWFCWLSSAVDDDWRSEIGGRLEDFVTLAADIRALGWEELNRS